MKRCALLLLIAAASLALSLPSVHAQEDVPLPDAEKCAPPCGYIWPVIGMDVQIDKLDLRTSKIGELPEKVDVHISYEWDMEQDGTGLPGDSDPMKITVIISKKPTWLTASLSPATCEFMILPHQNEYDVCTLELSLEVQPDYVPTSEADMDVVGKRLMLFATSEESGTYKKSYGVKDLRWTWDGPPTIDGQVVQAPQSTDEEAAPGLAPVALVIAVAALAATARRRR